MAVVHEEGRWGAKIRSERHILRRADDRLKHIKCGKYTGILRPRRNGPPYAQVAVYLALKPRLERSKSKRILLMSSPVKSFASETTMPKMPR